MKTGLRIGRTSVRRRQPNALSARRLLGRIRGHLWTVAPALLSFLQPPASPPAREFQAVLKDPAVGSVRLTGLLSEVAGAETIVLIVHGLSGNAMSPYCASAAQAAAQAGLSSLRLSLRGADYSGEDILHGGITQDLWVALVAPVIARYKHVLLLGYSVGGHIALRAAVERADPRLRAVAAICPPLDLCHATTAFDHPARWPYRLHIFRSLNKAYAATARRGRVQVPPAVVARALSGRERDSLTVVVRFGFRSAEDYYERESVAPRLHRLEIPSLVVMSRHDPLIPAETVIPAIAAASRALSTTWIEHGGHVYFPKGLDLGQPGPPGLEPQVIRWLKERI
ncbi:MAG TPA: alpha/beta fold hydrolase [Blastocatellia bacterium]|nr:alpha/beta fold hydrolase [Blastocatellia bacterium]